MGKKTNWTATEDLTLCRAWLNASEAVMPQPTGDQKASTFWNVVYHLFHAELDTSVERPHNGLKIRWTRINRDVQKFALIFAQMQALAVELKGSSAAAGAVMLGDSIESDAHSEQQCVDDAKEQFFKEYETKFPFEACWKLLRYSPKWVQLLANSAGVSASHHANSAVAHHFLGVDSMPRIEDVAAAAAAAASGTEMNGSGATSNSVSNISNGANKRRALTLLESYGRGPIQQLQEVTSCLVDEMKRRNELLEEQNAIALFRLETDIIEDDDAREYFDLLRRRYVKRMRAAMALSSAQAAVAASASASVAVAATAPPAADLSSGSVRGLGDALAASTASEEKDDQQQQQQHNHLTGDASKGLDQRSTGVV